MANSIDTTSTHYKGKFASIYDVNLSFPNGGVDGDYVDIDGWAHYWNADRGTWCVNEKRDEYWDELITSVDEALDNFIKSQAERDAVQDTEIGKKVDKTDFDNAVKSQADRDSAQDTEIGKKVNKTDFDDTVKAQAERDSAQDTEIGKKFDKSNVVQELGDSDDKVVSQRALPLRAVESPEYLYCIVDAEDHFLFGIRQGGSVEWGEGIPSPIQKRLQEIVTEQEQIKTDLKRNVLSVSFDRSTGQIIGTTSERSRITGCVQDRITGKIIMNHQLE